MTQELQISEKEPVLQATAEEMIRPENACRPEVDIFYNPDGYLFQVDLPGVREGDIQLEVDEKNTLVLRASNRQDFRGEVLLQQTPLLNYYRAFRLGDDIDRDQIRARFEQGVLSVELSRRAEVKPRRIEIKIN
jgi:HSP20 family protein